MISKAIIKKLKLNAGLTSLAGGAAKLFAEVGQKEPSVIVKQNGKTKITEEIPNLKLASVQVLVSGYSIDAGEAIADAAISAMLLLEGVTITDGTRSFAVKAVSHRDGPTLVSWASVNTLSANLTFTFFEVTT